VYVPDFFQMNYGSGFVSKMLSSQIFLEGNEHSRHCNFLFVSKVGNMKIEILLFFPHSHNVAHV
jgi:hypothetical protein